MVRDRKMKISKQSRREAKGLFRAAQVNGILDDTKVRQAVDLVLSSKPRGYIGTLAHFQRLVKLEIERRTARIETVTPLDQAQQGQVRSALTNRYGPGLTFVFGENPGLIGGMRIQIGSDVYDGSIQSRLAQLQEA
jgi:F-type H+-transporting ATPase subunit delta